MTEPSTAASEPTDIEVTYQPDRSTYEVTVAGDVVGRADYVAEGDNVVFTHTIVKPEHRGRGIAGRLVEHAVEDVRGKGLHPVGQCWYVADYLADHPA